MNPIDQLVQSWAKQASSYEQDGQTGAALLKRCIRELVQAAKDAGMHIVTRNEAAVRSGVHPDTLTRLVRQGKLTNYGTKYAPRFRVADLPRRVSGVVDSGAVGGLGVGEPSDPE